MKKFLFTIIMIFMLILPYKIQAKSISYIDFKNVSNTTYFLAETTNYDTDVFGYLDTVKCGNSEIPAPIPKIIRTIVNVIKIITPLVLIIIGMIDIIKAVTASDEKKLKESQNKFIKRLIPAIMVFLVISIIQFIVSLIADDNKSIMNCVSCMISDSNSCILIDKPDAPKPTPGTSDTPSKPGNTNKDTTLITSAKDIKFTYEYFDGNLPYALYTPSTAKTNKSTPLIIWLHGVDEIGVDESTFKKSGLLDVLNKWKLDGFNAYILCPKLPNASGWDTKRSQFFSLINKIISEKNINTNKIILVGHSYGTIGLVHYAKYKQEMFSALTFLSGYYSSDMSSLKKIPTRGYIGDSDMKESIQFMDIYFTGTFGKKNLYTVKAGHGGVPKAAFTLDENKDNKSDLIEWMLAQNK